jgi:hypothetical protein
MMSIESNTNNIERRTKRNTQALAIWTGAWLASLALVAFGPLYLWNYQQVITIFSIVLNMGMGYKMIMANKKNLEDLDELQQRIHLLAMALSLGVSMVFGAVFGLLETVKLVAFHPNPSSVLFVMGITYGVGMLLSHRKYS